MEGRPSGHLKQLVFEALQGGDKLDPSHFSHDGKQLFVRVDQLVITDEAMTFSAGGKPLFSYELPRRSEGGVVEINLSPRSCIEIQVTY